MKNFLQKPNIKKEYKSCTRKVILTSLCISKVRNKGLYTGRFREDLWSELDGFISVLSLKSSLFSRDQMSMGVCSTYVSSDLCTQSVFPTLTSAALKFPNSLDSQGGTCWRLMVQASVSFMSTGQRGIITVLRSIQMFLSFHFKAIIYEPLCRDQAPMGVKYSTGGSVLLRSYC